MASVVTSPSDIQTAIRRVVESGRPVRLAVAFWGDNALQTLGLDNGSLEGRIEVLCNLPSGGCNPKVIRDLLARGATVKSLSNLHAKVYLGQDVAVVGSANLSQGGLGLYSNSKDNWEEACQIAEEPADLDLLSIWWSRIWKGSDDLSNPSVAKRLFDLAKRRRAAQKGLMSGPEAPDTKDLLSAVRSGWIPHPGQSVHIVLDWIPYDKETKKEVKDRRAEDELVGAWQDWPAMPPNSQLLSFWRTEGGVYSYHCAYQSPEEIKKNTDKRGSIFTYEVDKILERYRLGNKKVWIEAAKRMYENRGYGWRDGNQCCGLEQFANKFLLPAAKDILG